MPPFDPHSLLSHLDLYKKELIQKIQEIDGEVLCDIVNAFEMVHKKKSRIFVIGNGGSAATAAHMVNDFGVGLRSKGLLNLNISSLVDNIPTVTAVSNDVSYDDIFTMQLDGLIGSDDILIAISCSGNSKNIINAVRYAKKTGSTVISLTGFDGGELRCLSDIQFHVDTEDGKYGLVEDIHMIFDHILYSYFTGKR